MLWPERGLRPHFVARVTAIAVLAVIGAMAAPSAQAGTLTVTNNADTGGGTLRDRLAMANAGDTILVPGSFTIMLASPLTVTQLTSHGSVTIASTGSGTPTISGASVTRIFVMNSHTGLTLRHLTLSDGKSASDGGAIDALDHNTVAIVNSTVKDSAAAAGDAGAIFMGGPGNLTVTNSTITNNSGGGDGGAIFIGAPANVTVTKSTITNNSTSSGAGGAVFLSNPGSMTVTDSTFSGNHTSSGRGGAIHLNHPGTLTINRSTFSGNYTSAGDGGAIQMNSDTATTLTATNSTFNGNHADAGNGGAIKMDRDTSTFLTNTTLANNIASGDGGAILLDANSTAGATARFLNDTIRGNQAGAATGNGGGVRLLDSPFNDVAFKNTIVSGNTASSGINCSYVPPEIVSQGHNDEQGTTCGFTGPGDLNADPKLGLLASNGGPTQTMALLAGSPAINGGTNNGCPATDQRGVARPQAGICDIGALEAIRKPHCTLKSNGSKVHLAKHKTVGTLSLTARCDEAASLKLTGKIKRKKGKATGPGKTFTIHALSAAARANVPVGFTVKVPGAALDSLKAGAKESASFTLTGKNPSGSATATAKIGRLKL